MKLFCRISSFKPAFAFGILLIGAAVFYPQSDTSKISSQKTSVEEFEVNGLKVIVRDRPSAKTVAGGLFIRGGARNISGKNAGIENFALSVAIEGSKNFPKELLRRELAATGSNLGASSSNDYSVLNFAAMSANFEQTWRIFSDVVLNPTFAPADVDRVRDLIVTALRNREDDPDSFLEALQERVIYADHPYANDVNGTVDTVSQLKPDDLKAYHKELLETSRMLLVVVGNVNPEMVRATVLNSFGKLPKGDYQEKAYPNLDFASSTLDIASRPLPTNYIKGVFDAPSISESDYYPMRVAVTILRNRLFEEVRQNRQLSYAPSAGLDTFAANTGNIYVTAVDANRTISVMLDEVKRLRREPVSQYEIESVAGGFLTSYFLEKETNAAQAVSLAQFELIGGGWQNSFDFLDKIRGVSPEDVTAVARKYMKNLRFVVIGNPVAVERSIFLQSLE